MKFSKLTLAVATTLGASASFSAFAAMDLYVDTKTKQIYAEPGRGRVLMGSFERVEDKPAVASAPAAAPAPAEVTAMKQDLELKTNEIKALQEHMEEQEKTEVKLGDKGLEIATKDGNFKMAMGGRIQLDAQVNDNGSNIPEAAKLNDGIGVRRGRWHMEGTVYKDFDFKFEYDFVRGNGSNAAGITDAFIEYNGLKPVGLTFGQFKEPFSLESVTSNRFITFAERSLPNNAFIEFANPYELGISAQTYGERYTGRLALQAEPIGNGGYNNNTSTNSNGNANRNGVSGNPSYGVTGRATFLPIFKSKTQLLHVGGAASYRSVNNASNGTQAMTFASQANANVDRQNWANTGSLTDLLGTPNRRVLDNFYRVGGELMGIYGPASFQAEYMHTQLNGQNYSSNDHFDGYYAYVTYFLTGESRNYDTKNGKMNRQKPAKNFSLKNGGWGAWEVAARFDSLNMNTQHVSGGNLQNGTLALNWYLNPHVRFMANYEHVFHNNVSLASNGAGGFYAAPALISSGQHPNVFMFRTQLDW